MMESLILKKENLIKHIRNNFRLWKDLDWTVIKDIKNICWQEKETETIK